MSMTFKEREVNEKLALIDRLKKEIAQLEGKIK